MARAEKFFRGAERLAIIEIVRSLDEAAFAFRVAPNAAELRIQDTFRNQLLLGAASALRPLLERIGGTDGGVPWGPSSPARRQLTDEHLAACGRFAIVERALALQRYGLATARFLSDDHLLVNVENSEDDERERDAGAWLGTRERVQWTAGFQRLTQLKSKIASDIDSLVGVENGWFIRYDNSYDLVQYHRNIAELSASGIAEAHAITASRPFGGRSFESWNGASIDAYGRVLGHMAFATRLKATHPHLDLRNLLTVYVRRDDLHDVWLEAGETAAGAEAVTDAMTLDADRALLAEREYELPVPYYVDFGRDFVLLPMFGGLMNAYSGVVEHLRRCHRQDWDRAVGDREGIFRNELRLLLRPEAYEVPIRGYRIKRPNGTVISDIDAVVVERQSGTVALVQLKWPDVYGRSLRERDSRRKNLLAASEWVALVHDWVGGRTSRDVASALGLTGAGDAKPLIIVMSRHIARFSGEDGYDSRAQWVSWPEFVGLAEEDSPLFERLAGSKMATAQRPKIRLASCIELEGLTVEFVQQGLAEETPPGSSDGFP
jgi:hypothetical protein